MSETPDFDIHPDMRDLMAAKQNVVQLAAVNDARTGWNAYGASLARPYPDGMVVTDMSLPCPGAGTAGLIPVRIYRPAGVAQPSPCVVYLHGGAFIKGSLDSGDSNAWGVADRTGAIVVSVDYRLAPDNPFPAGVEDCYAAVLYLAEHGAELGIDGSRIGLWGDSAGGNMAAAVCLMARDRGRPKISAQVLIYPALTDDLSAEAYIKYALAPVSAASIDRAWNLYLGDRRPISNGYAAPLKAPDLSNLPPAHVHFAEIDCLADDSRSFAQRLAEAGNDVTLCCAERMIHGFLRARFTGPDAAEEFEKPCRFLRQKLAIRLPETV